MPIRKFGDTGDDILFQCSLTSAAAVTSAGGTVIGTATFDDDGMLAGSAGSAVFTNYTGNAALKYEGQICFTVEKDPCCARDTSATYVSGSRGVDLAVARYLLSGADSADADQMRLYVSAAEQLTFRIGSGDTAIAKAITTIGKGATIDGCLWWDGKRFGLIVDGAPVGEGVRVTQTNSFYKLVAAAAKNTTSTPLVGYRMTNIIVSRNSPRLALSGLSSIGLFGDSYVEQAIAADSIRYDMEVKKQLLALFHNDGLAPRIFGNSDGSPLYAGHTICDTGANDLSTYFSTFNARLPEVAVIMALNNDAVTITASDAQYSHATTGTEANLKTLILLLAANGRTRKLGITTPGSLRQYTSLDTAANVTRVTAIGTLLDALPAWYLSNKPANSVLAEIEILDLKAALGGDSDTNVNYNGYWDSLGNLNHGGTKQPGAMADRHPHASGAKLIAEMIHNFAR